MPLNIISRRFAFLLAFLFFTSSVVNARVTSINNSPSHGEDSSIVATTSTLFPRKVPRINGNFQRIKARACSTCKSKVYWVLVKNVGVKPLQRLVYIRGATTKKMSLRKCRLCHDSKYSVLVPPPPDPSPKAKSSRSTILDRAIDPITDFDPTSIFLDHNEAQWGPVAIYGLKQDPYYAKDLIYCGSMANVTGMTLPLDATENVPQVAASACTEYYDNEIGNSPSRSSRSYVVLFLHISSTNKFIISLYTSNNQCCWLFIR